MIRVYDLLPFNVPTSNCPLLIPIKREAKVDLRIRSSLLWDFMRRRLVFDYRRCGTTYRYHLQWSHNKRSWTTNLRRVISQKTEGL
jgi:hypothetical protein